MLKKLSIALLFLMFFTFLIYQTKKSVEFSVLKIVTPCEIVVDLNNNGSEDLNENYLLKNVECFTLSNSQNQLRLAQQANITPEDALGIGFLSRNFVEDFISTKKVKLIGSTLYIDNKNYEKTLVDKGFVIQKNKSSMKAFLSNIKKVHKLNLVIFNNKSHKYHKLNCKYGHIAHDAQVLPKAQLPKDAKACKFCHNEKQNIKGQLQKAHNEEILKIKCPNTAFRLGSMKMFLTDLTQVLKPSNTCDTSICKALLSEIYSAQNTIDFAIYGYSNIPKLQTALKDAQNRGVRIRFVYDIDSKGENIYPDTKLLAKDFINNKADYSPAIMHDKFFIFDNKRVYTGSANISNTDMSGFNSNAVLILDSKEVADFYTAEFEQMYQGNFHVNKTPIGPKKTCFDNSQIAIYFSPKDKGMDSVLTLVDNSQKYIYMPIFLITHKDLVNSLVNAHNRGVDVKIILDATNASTPYSKHNILRKAGIEVKTENFAGKMHSKSMIVDDKYTIIGSTNFSNSAENKNDENRVIIENTTLAIFYKNFFNYLWQKIPNYWLTHNARAESFDSIGSCSDAIDNDFDGKIDKADDGCLMRR